MILDNLVSKNLLKICVIKFSSVNKVLFENSRSFLICGIKPNWIETELYTFSTFPKKSA